jgi:murein DD-endopeptidase MepM/ murein hydrolase activator NlpD
VVIKSSDGIETLYAHLEALAVRKGQKVRQGQALGRVGCTGHCSGPHLHFEVYDNGRRQDPMRYLP